MAKPQTEATKKYSLKVGLISKSFRLKRDLCEQFKEACEKTGESQAAAITAFMKDYIEKANTRKD